MGVLLELLAIVDTSFRNEFDEAITLTHRAFWFTLNPFNSSGDVMRSYSMLGKVVGGEFRGFGPSGQTVTYTKVETKALVTGGGFLAAVVAAHKAKLGMS